MPFSIDRRVFKGGLFLSACLGLSFLTPFPSLRLFFLILLGYHISFFRDPLPKTALPHQILAPASGTIVEISIVPENRYLQKEAVRIGIFLSLFDVHVNRAPMAGRIEYMKYEPGTFFNAMTAEASRKNECVWIGLEKEGKKVLVRPISGAIARRICRDVSEKQSVTQGEKIGIICYGSRAELYLPKDTFKLNVQVGQKTQVGRTILGEWTL